MIKKAEKMYLLSGGKTEGHKCSECSNFCERWWDKKYFKCQIYGTSASAATDWAKSYTACAWFNQDRPECNLVKIRIRESIEEPEIEGQISFADLIENFEEVK